VKIASHNLTNLLLDHVARKRLPILFPRGWRT
jgi:hypothetical protein